MGRAGRPASGRMWYPSADVYRTRDGWVVKVELAGVRADEIEIRVERDSLHIAGCRQDTYYSESLSYHQLEITYSRFEKTVSFPCPGSTVTSTVSNSPPTSVHARPTTWPTWLWSSARP